MDAQSTVQKFGVSKIFLMFLKVSYSHQGCKKRDLIGPYLMSPNFVNWYCNI